MKLTAEEETILAGRWGEPARRALEMQIVTGEFFGAEEMVPVASAHLTGDAESMGDAGLTFVEDLAREGARFVVPTTTNSRNVDFACYRELGQPEEVARKERRLCELADAGPDGGRPDRGLGARGPEGRPRRGQATVMKQEVKLSMFPRSSATSTTTGRRSSGARPRRLVTPCR